MSKNRYRLEKKSFKLQDNGTTGTRQRDNGDETPGDRDNGTIRLRGRTKDNGDVQFIDNGSFYLFLDMIWTVYIVCLDFGRSPTSWSTAKSSRNLPNDL